MFQFNMEQLEQSGDFAADCRRLFAPEHGRRWKTAAAASLAIGRTTLYRYLSGDQPVPAAVRARLVQLAKQPANPYAGRIFLGEERMTPEQHIADNSRPFTGALPWKRTSRACDHGAPRMISPTGPAWSYT